MNNPGVDIETWQGLRKKWSELDAAGHTVKVDFQLLADPRDDKNILAIDIVQHIDEDVITETVQRKAGEAYEPLGIAGLSVERLVEVYKEMLEKLYSQQIKPGDTALVVTMSPSSETSGETRCYVQNSGVQSSLPVDYRHYYVLNALREKMMAVGDAWSKVRAVYESGGLEFYFE